ncbi:MAG: hypothetical protein N3E37_03795 [Candidatus Micrarchaeota archaeon]|nr:hypothetical protein [Candidatus Micrarchaeota archaeon]
MVTQPDENGEENGQNVPPAREVPNQQNQGTHQGHQEEQQNSQNSLSRRFLMGIVRTIALAGLTYGIYAISMVPGLNIVGTVFQIAQTIASSVAAFLAAASLYDVIATATQLHQIGKAINTLRNATSATETDQQENQNQRENSQSQISQNALRYYAWLAHHHRDTPEGAELYSLLVAYVSSNPQLFQQQNPNNPNNQQDENQANQQLDPEQIIARLAEQRQSKVLGFTVLKYAIAVIAAAVTGILTYLRLEGIRQKLMDAHSYLDSATKFSDYVKSADAKELANHSIGEIAEKAGADVDQIVSHHGNTGKLGLEAAQRLKQYVEDGVFQNHGNNVWNAALAEKPHGGPLKNPILEQIFTDSKVGPNKVYEPHASTIAHVKASGATLGGLVAAAINRFRRNARMEDQRRNNDNQNRGRERQGHRA